MKKVYVLILIASILAATAPSFVSAAVYGKISMSAKTIRASYKNDDLKVLIVPGHEPAQGGTLYADVREREVVLMIADELEKLIAKDDGITSYRTRDEDGWTPTFTEYFEEEWGNIINWVADQKYETGILAEKGKLERTGGSSHNDAAPDVALRLYGINKWSNENDIDIALHLHINDVPRPDTAVPGDYVGFAIYVPEKQYSNAKASKELANDMKKRLKKVMKVSNLPQEKKGVIEEQDLIAIGSHNTSDAASILIEYGYIYESQYETEKKQRAFAKKVAKQTYEGLRDFLR